MSSTDVAIVTASAVGVLIMWGNFFLVKDKPDAFRRVVAVDLIVLAVAFSVAAVLVSR